MAYSKLLLAVCFALVGGAAAAQWYQGPSGGTGGASFDFWGDSSHATVVSSVGVIDTGQIRCLQITYRGTPTNPGRPTTFSHGSCDTGAGTPGFTGSRGFSLDPDEYLIGVAGRYGDHIDSIQFFTNKRNSPVFGGSGGSVTFGYTAPAGHMIVAFTGQAGDSLDAIGVMYASCRAYKTCK